ncbi:MAG: hypothetical protein F4Y48_13965, partial [Gammaproteobacteria bacterium]|nr:hypothetical protein [Gammaproteobacteria bacterium]
MWRSDRAGTLRPLLFAALLCGLPLVSGCYTYRLVEEAPVGSVARLRVPIQSAIVDPNAPPETVAIEGLIISFGDTISFEASNRQVIGAFREVVQYDTLQVARDGLASIEVREFSRARSVVLGVAVAAGTVGLALAALGVEGGAAGEKPGEG